MSQSLTYKGYTCTYTISNDGECNCSISGLGGRNFLFSRDTLGEAESRFHEVVDYFLKTNELLGA